MGRHRRLAGLGAVALTLALAPAASAATVSVTGRTLHWTGGGWPNITVTAGVAVVTDGVTLPTPGSGCVTEAVIVIRCLGVDDAVVELGPAGWNVTIDTFSTGPVTVIGGDGNDYVDNRGAGALDFQGGGGRDNLDFALAPATTPESFSGGPGFDSVSYAHRKTAVGISLDDVANDGAPGEGDNIHSDVEIVEGGDGDDTITGSAGADYLSGRGGDDTLRGLGGNDGLDGAGGGVCGHDVLEGGEGDDGLALEGNTTADGGPGDDALGPGSGECAGPDLAHGGPGTDTASFSGFYSANPISVSLDDVADDGKDGLDDYASDIENLTGGDYGMALIGNDGPNVITGGRGDDLLDGGGGTDALTGGGGIDVADYSLRWAPVSLTLDGVANDGEAGELDSLGTDIEDLIGGDGDDTLTGNGAKNVLDGGPGADTMRGGGRLDAVDYSWRGEPVSADADGEPGDDGEDGEGDTIAADVEGLFGGEGDDTLTGNALNGFVAGFGGDDEISDLGGDDWLDGGDGDDAIDSQDFWEDAVACGDGHDGVTRDTVDEVDEDCEDVTPGLDDEEEETPEESESPTPTATPVHTPGPVRDVPRVLPRLPLAPVHRIDRVAPHVTALVVDAHPRTRGVLAHGLALSVGCDEPCTVTAELRATSATVRTLRRRGVRAGGALARGAIGDLGTGTRAVRVALNATGRRALRRLATGAYTLTVTVADRAGNARHEALRLRPR